MTVAEYGVANHGQWVYAASRQDLPPHDRSSMTTGETFGSVTRMSGRFAPCFKMPVFSELTMPGCDHARRVVRTN